MLKKIKLKSSQKKIFRHSAVAVISTLAIGVSSDIAHGATLNVGSFNVGQVLNLDPSGPEAVAGFEGGEDVIMSFTFDDTITDANAGLGTSSFIDPNGTITLTGATSSASVTYFGGVVLNFDDNREFEIESLLGDADALNPQILRRDIDFLSATPYFSNVDDLATTLAEVALINPSTFTNISTSGSRTEYFNGTSSITGMDIGPVPNRPVPDNPEDVPEPLTILGSAFAIAFGAKFKNKKAQA